MPKNTAAAGENPLPTSALINWKIAELGDGRGRMLDRARRLVHATEPETRRDISARPAAPLDIGHPHLPVAEPPCPMEEMLTY